MHRSLLFGSFFFRVRLLVVVWMPFLLLLCGAYRVGDEIDTQVSFDTTTAPFQDVWRHQAPMFGIPTQGQFPVKQSVTDNEENDLSGNISSRRSVLSLSFAYGLWRLPIFPVWDSQGRCLQSVVVTFTHSRSAGTIRSVTSQAHYETSTNQKDNEDPMVVLVSYQWMEDAPHQQLPTTTAGQAVMYFMVFCGSVWLLWMSCHGGLEADNDDDATARMHHGAATTTSSTVPKWD